MKATTQVRRKNEANYGKNGKNQAHFSGTEALLVRHLQYRPLSVRQRRPIHAQPTPHALAWPLLAPSRHLPVSKVGHHPPSRALKSHLMPPITFNLHLPLPAVTCPQNLPHVFGDNQPPPATTFPQELPHDSSHLQPPPATTCRHVPSIATSTSFNNTPSPAWHQVPSTGISLPQVDGQNLHPPPTYRHAPPTTSSCLWLPHSNASTAPAHAVTCPQQPAFNCPQIPLFAPPPLPNQKKCRKTGPH